MKKSEYPYAIWMLLLPLMGILQSLDFAVDLIDDLWKLWFLISGVILCPIFFLYIWIKEGCEKETLLPGIGGMIVISTIILRIGGVI